MYDGVMRGCRCYGYQFDPKENVGAQAIGYVNGWHCCCIFQTVIEFANVRNPIAHVQIRDFAADVDVDSDLNTIVTEYEGGWRYVG